MPDSDESKREVRADTRDVRADARDDRAGARDTRADVRDVAADDRDVRADTREEVAVEREVITDEKESRAWRLLRYVGFLATVLTVISVGNFVRSFYNQDATEKAITAAEHVQETVEEGRDISRDTLKELRAIVARIESSNSDEPDLSNQAILDALAAISRMEAFLCGGPCEPRR